MFPTGSLITFVPGASYSLYADTVEREFIIEKFDRLENSNVKRREAPTTTGAKPLLGTTFGGKPIQLASTCTGDVIRPLGPDDDNINTIKRRFNITRYTIAGAPSYATQVDAIHALAIVHAQKLDRFDLHLEKLQMELSITKIETLRSETFSFLLTTGLNLTGISIGGTLTSALIYRFTSSPAYLISSSGALVKDWTAVVDIRTDTARE